MGIRLRRRDGSCLETGVRGNGELINDGTRGRRVGRRRRRGGGRIND